MTTTPMTTTFRRPLRPFLAPLLTVVLCLLSAAAAYADAWTPPTPEELSMTSQAGAPGASAVYLFREQKTYDKFRLYTNYVRLKVLKEGGKEFGNVEISYNARGAGFSVSEIEGRTIHPDGTIIPFTGKPYDKLIERTKTDRYMAKVFSLPDVEVGSIIEYRYNLHYDDTYYVAPSWSVQNNVYTRKAHFTWEPTGRSVLTSGREQLTSAISWTPILPVGVEVKLTTRPSPGAGNEPQRVFDLEVHDIPPMPREAYMPPLASVSYRVLFYYTPYRDRDEFWANEGKYWSGKQNKFIGPGPGVRAAVAQLTVPTDSPDQKLHKLYAAVQSMDNTDFSREHSTGEDKAEGLRELRNTDDILARKRGSSSELTSLFVAMARAAGSQAFLMAVADRDERLFLPIYLNLNQLDSEVAIVTVDGKELWLDPGSPFCPFGQLFWTHAGSGGLRQTQKGAELANTPTDSYKASTIKRIADLHMDDHGAVTGFITIAWEGSPATTWRQAALKEDDVNLSRRIRESIESFVPPGLELKVVSIDRLKDAAQPLLVRFDVTGHPASATGKRLLLTGDLFQSRETETFSQPTREIPVSFHFPFSSYDAVRIHLPPGLTVESAPEKKDLSFGNFAAYTYTADTSPDAVTIRRNLFLGETIFFPKEYPQLRTFYSQLETSDRQTVVLKAAAPATAKVGSGAN